jgi:hypothetical protein
VQYKALLVLGNLFGGFLEARVNFLPFFIFVFNLLPYHRRLPEATLVQLIYLCSNLFQLFDGYSLAPSISPTKTTNNWTARNQAENSEEEDEKIPLTPFAPSYRDALMHNNSGTRNNSNDTPLRFTHSPAMHSSHRSERSGKHLDDEETEAFYSKHVRVAVQILEPASASHSHSPVTQSTPTASTGTDTTDSYADLICLFVCLLCLLALFAFIAFDFSCLFVCLFVFFFFVFLFVFFRFVFFSFCFLFVLVFLVYFLSVIHLQILLVIWNLENVMIVLAPIHNCLHLM